jgi:1-acyl-sn-glycerol-3-phosphate acyltransferase
VQVILLAVCLQGIDGTIPCRLIGMMGILAFCLICYPSQRTSLQYCKGRVISMVVNTFLYWLARLVVKAYANTMLKINVEKRAPFPPGPKIIAANHPTISDPFLVASILGKSHILITNDVFEMPVAGACLRRLGHIPVVEGNGQAALDRAVELLKQGKTIVIFPEGGLSPSDGGFKEARTGVARLALLSGAPVIPVGIHLKSERINRFSCIKDGKREDRVWYLRGPYFITIGKPLVIEGDVEDRAFVREFALHVMHQIVKLAFQSELRMNQTLPSISRLPA